MLTLNRFFGLLLCVVGLLPLHAEEVKAEIKTEAKSEDPPFVLKATQEDGAVIEEIITTLSRNNLLALGFKRSHLKQLGTKLRHLGPLQFLGYIFSHDSLKVHMVSIRNNSTKWKGFMDGLAPGLNRDASNQKLFSDLPGFAKFLHADGNVLKEKAESREWYAFVDHIQNASLVAGGELPVQGDSPKQELQQTPVDGAVSSTESTDQVVSATPAEQAASSSGK